MRFREFRLFESADQIIDEDFSADQVMRLEQWTIPMFARKGINVSFANHFAVRLSRRTTGAEPYSQNIDDVGRLFFTIFMDPGILTEKGATAATRWAERGNAAQFVLDFTLENNPCQMLVNYLGTNNFQFNTINLNGGLGLPVPKIGMRVVDGRLNDLVADYNTNPTSGTSGMQHLRQKILRAEDSIVGYFKIQGDELRKSAADLVRQYNHEDENLFTEAVNRAERSLAIMQQIFPDFNSIRANQSITRMVQNVANNRYSGEDSMNGYSGSVSQYLNTNIRGPNIDVRNEIAREQGYDERETNKILEWMRNNLNDPRVRNVVARNEKLKTLIHNLAVLESTPIGNQPVNRNSDLGTIDTNTVDPITGNIRQTPETSNQRRTTKAEIENQRRRTFNGTVYSTPREAQRARALAQKEQQRAATMTPVQKVIDYIKQLLEKPPRQGENAIATTKVTTVLQGIYNSVIENEFWLSDPDTIDEAYNAYVKNGVDNLSNTNSQIIQNSRFNELGTPARLKEFINNIKTSLGQSV